MRLTEPLYLFQPPQESPMSEMTAPESRARLGYHLSELLSLPTLPDDLNQAINDHLKRQLSIVNILKPEYCLRLYPVLAELTDLAARDAESQAPIEVAPQSHELVTADAESDSDETSAETVNGAAHDSFGGASAERGRYD